MSRVAKMPVTVPAGVDVTINEQHISVKGAGGQLSIANNALVKVVRQGESMTFEPANESREANAMSGTLRQLVNNRRRPQKPGRCDCLSKTQHSANTKVDV